MGQIKKIKISGSPQVTLANTPNCDYATLYSAHHEITRNLGALNLLAHTFFSSSKHGCLSRTPTWPDHNDIYKLVKLYISVQIPRKTSVRVRVGGMGAWLDVAPG